jgi:glycosyltransferase involved in cell wall biosynthesis
VPWREARLEPKFWLFNRFYTFLYGVFIRRNYLVIVQQEWMRQALNKRFGSLPIVVAHPDVRIRTSDKAYSSISTEATTYVLLYPTLPRVFKNIETVMEAAHRLAINGFMGVELRVTLKGDENPYARWLYAKYHSSTGVRFIGRQTPDQMVQQYKEAHAVVFPSKLETWGLPISEAKAWSKPLLVADLPYSRETVGSYDQVVFLPATDIDAWMHEFKSLALDDWYPLPTIGESVPEPFDASWPALWERLVQGL